MHLLVIILLAALVYFVVKIYTELKRRKRED